MTKIRKRLFTWLLVLVLAFGLLPGAYIAAGAEEGEEPRDTEFFTPREHTDLNYDEIEYEHIDPEALLAEMDALRELFGDEANAAEFQTRFLALADETMRQEAMYIIVSNMQYADSKDEWAAAEAERVYQEILEVSDAFDGLVRDALSSPCAGVFDGLLSPGLRGYYLDYEDMSGELKDLLAQDSALQSEYMSKAADRYTFDYNGTVYDDGSAWEAYRKGELSYDEYELVARGIAQSANAVLGEIYVRMVKVRNRIAALEGYDNYAEYAYASTYSRDYGTAEAQEFCEAVKTGIVPLFHAVDAAVYSPDQSAMPRDVAYSGEGMFETLFPCFAQLSDELLESARYTYDHRAYDVDPAPNKVGTAYSWLIPYYNIPFYFSNACGDWNDLCTTIHELGHNNEAYWNTDAWNMPGLSIDTAEVNSQGLELLMFRFYPELFGDQAEEVQAYQVYQMLWRMVTGAEYDELERRVYALPEVTLEAVNQTYRQLAEEYGFIDAEDERTELYGWTDVPHFFTFPLYYISYGTSAAGSFAFWAEAQEDWFAAADDYLLFTAIGRDQGFKDTFLAIGMESPMSETYLRDLAELIRDKLLRVEPFTDVHMDDWCGSYVAYVYHYGLMNGVSGDRFAPNDFATRGQCMTVLARSGRQEGEDAFADGVIGLKEGAAWAVNKGISDGSDLSGVLTREQLAAMFYRFAQYLGLEAEADAYILDSFDDASDISGWAREAMAWACATGLLEDTYPGHIAPKGEITRAYLAQMVQYFWWYIY